MTLQVAREENGVMVRIGRGRNIQVWRFGLLQDYNRFGYGRQSDDLGWAFWIAVFHRCLMVYRVAWETP